MKLYLVRHAEALDVMVNSKRPLSENGKRHAKQLADFLRPQGVLVADIYQSGELRAQQTAEILAESMAPGRSMRILPALNNISEIPALMELISGLVDDVLLVGHIPVLPRLITMLTSPNAYREIVNFQPATLVCLQKIDFEQWLIDWVLTPEILNNKSC